MSLAVIGTFWRRPWVYPRIAQAIREQTHQPDELWLMYEDPSDEAVLRAQDWGSAVTFIWPFEVPRNDSGGPEAVPPSLGINIALNWTEADCVAYLTDDSLPFPEKYERMAERLSDAQAVYCSQDFGSVASPDDWLASVYSAGSVRFAAVPQSEPFCQVDHTQVAHRTSDDRWPTSMDEIRWSDGAFFKLLVARFGALQPIGEVLDWTRQLPDGLSSR